MIKALEVDIPTDYKVLVETTHERGFTPEEVAERCADKIIQISEDSHPGIRDQAYAFRQHLVKVLAFYMREAIKSDRTTTYNTLSKAGYKELAEQLRRL
jgi:hypothetical protein